MQAWEEFLLRQEQELGRETVHKWLRSLKVVRFDAGNLYLEAKDSFQSLWFEEHIRPKVLNLVNNNNKKIRVHLSIANRNPNIQKKRPIKPAIKNSPRHPFHLHFDQLDPLCTFDHFHEIEENRVPLELLKNGLTEFNPIYLWGPSGCGKTHLALSVAHAQHLMGKRVLYTRAETFTDHVVAAIRAGEMVQFRDTYRNAEVLIVDDVHVFGRKGATQEEFFHTFNTLHLAGKQIILTSKCPPSELIEVEPRLISRFEWGIVLPIEASKEKALEPILKKKAQALNYPLPPKVAEFLIESFPSGAKAIMNALSALILRSHIGHGDSKPMFRPMTVQLAKHYLSDLLLVEKQHALTSEKIIQASSDHFGIRPEDILGKAQTRDCTLPRQIAMFLCRHHLKLPFNTIGDIFGRDHSTVMSSVRLIQQGKDPEMAAAIQEIDKKIGR